MGHYVYIVLGVVVVLIISAIFKMMKKGEK